MLYITNVTHGLEDGWLHWTEIKWLSESKWGPYCWNFCLLRFLRLCDWLELNWGCRRQLYLSGHNDLEKKWIFYITKSTKLPLHPFASDSWYYGLGGAQLGWLKTNAPPHFVLVLFFPSEFTNLRWKRILYHNKKYAVGLSICLSILGLVGWQSPAGLTRTHVL